MFIIECNRNFKKQGVTQKAYVANHPTSGENASFTTDERLAHNFSNMAECKNIRDDVLQVADKVTIFKV